MRLLRIDHGGEAGAIEIHPQVTVIGGLRGAARARVVEGLRGLGSGNLAIGGEFEIDGANSELTAEALAGLALPGDIDPVVAAGDLPGAQSGAARDAARRQHLEFDRDELATRLAALATAASAAEAERAEASEALAALGGDDGEPGVDPEALASQIAEAEARLAAVGEALARADEALARSQAEYADLEVAAGGADELDELHDRHSTLRATTSQLADAVDTAQGLLDAGAEEAFEQAGAALDRAEAAARERAGRSEPPAVAPADPPRSKRAGRRGKSVGDAKTAGDDTAGPDGRATGDGTAAADATSVAVLYGRRDNLQRALLPLAPLDTAPVVEALEATAAQADGRPDDASLGRALADQWDQITQHLEELGIDPAAPLPEDLFDHAHDDADGELPADADTSNGDVSDSGDADASDASVESLAEARVADAKRDLAEVLSSVGSGPLPAEEIAALEAAHVEVLEAQERSEARFAGSKAKRRLATAREAEQAILDRLRFATYAEFMMSAARTMSADDEDLVEASRRTLDDAERALSDAQAGADADEAPGERGDGPADPAAGDDISAWNEVEAHSVMKQFAELKAEVATVLGRTPGPDPTGVLRSLRPSGTSEEVSALHMALAQVGMAVDDAEFQVDTLVALARVWLSEQEAADAKRVELSEELAGVEAELAALEGVEAPEPAAEPATEPSAEQPDEPPDAEVTEAAAVRDQAQARLDRHNEAVADLVRLEAEFADAQVAEDALAAQISGLEASKADDQATREASLAAAAAAVRAAEETRDEALSDEQAARTARAELPDSADSIEEPEDPTPALAARLDAADRAIAAAAAEDQTLQLELASVERQLAAAIAAEESSPAEPAAFSEELLEDIEWYLLSRLANQKQVGRAGSLPLVLDDPFRGMGPAEATRLVAGIERMAGAVQLLVLSDDAAIVEWADGLGPERAAVVQVG